MATCAYCENPVALPFRCKLCLLQYCERHRLPENHECPNLDAYNTDDYRKFKSTLRDQSSGAVATDTSPSRIQWKSGDNYSGPTRGALFSGSTDYWSSGDKRYDMIYLAIIVGIRNVLFSLDQFTTPLLDLVQILFYSLLIGTVAFLSLLYIRERIAVANGISSMFYFSKLFVVLTILLSLISGMFGRGLFAIFIPGLFVMLSAGNIKSTYNVALRSAFAFLGFWFVFTVVVPPIILTITPSLSLAATSSFYVGNAILHIGLFTLFTEYRAISIWNRKMLAVVGILYLVAFFLR